MQNAVKLALLHPSWQHKPKASVLAEIAGAGILSKPSNDHFIAFIHHPGLPQSLKWKFSTRTVLIVYSITKSLSYLESGTLPPTSNLVAISRVGYIGVRSLQWQGKHIPQKSDMVSMLSCAEKQGGRENKLFLSPQWGNSPERSLQFSQIFQTDTKEQKDAENLKCAQPLCLKGSNHMEYAMAGQEKSVTRTQKYPDPLWSVYIKYIFIYIVEMPNQL